MSELQGLPAVANLWRLQRSGRNAWSRRRGSVLQPFVTKILVASAMSRQESFLGSVATLGSLEDGIAQMDGQGLDEEQLRLEKELQDHSVHSDGHVFVSVCYCCISYLKGTPGARSSSSEMLRQRLRLWTRHLLRRPFSEDNTPVDRLVRRIP